MKFALVGASFLILSGCAFIVPKIGDGVIFAPWSSYQSSVVRHG
jgi:hypothetical protein